MRPRILAVLPECPYPVDHGLRTHYSHHLETLCGTGETDVIGFARDEVEGARWKAQAERRGFRLRAVAPWARGAELRARQAMHLLRGEPPALGRYQSAGYRKLVREMARGGEYDWVVFFLYVTAVPLEGAPAMVLPVDCYSLAYERFWRCRAGWRDGLRAFYLWRSFRRWERREYARFDCVAPVSEVDAAALRELGLGERVRVVPVAARLAVERSNGRGAGWPRVVVAGNFTIPSIAADARRFLGAWRGRGGVELVVWGRGASALRREGSWAVEWVEDYAGFLASADVYVYPQRYAAGVQTKVQDAMRAGCAVVAARDTLLPLGAVDGREARYGGSPEEMVAMAGELACEPERTRAMGQAARALMERRFGAEVVAARLREALGVKELAAAGRGGGE